VNGYCRPVDLTRPTLPMPLTALGLTKYSKKDDGDEEKEEDDNAQMECRLFQV